jgi:hypothetical protein
MARWSGARRADLGRRPGAGLTGGERGVSTVRGGRADPDPGDPAAVELGDRQPAAGHVG